jgi:hypothetical protein
MKRPLLAALLLSGLAAQAQSLTFAPATQYSVNASINSLATADFNADGYLDIATVGSGSVVNILLNRPSGIFAAAVAYPIANSGNIYAVAASDLNNDGYADIVATSAGSPGLAVLINQKNGTFAPAVFYTGGGSEMTLSDIDRDGYPDIVTFTNGLPSVTVFPNQKNGTFAAATAYPTGGLTPSRLAVGDVNADGYPDVAVAAYTGSIGLLLNNKNGGLGSFTTYTAATGRQQRGIALGDLNRDGYADLVVIDGSDNTAKVGLATSSGTFAPLVSYATGTGPESVTVADLNNNGYPDLVVGNSNSNELSVLLTNPNGTLGVAAAYTSNGVGYVSSVKVADVNKDGKPDILAANSFNASVGVLLGTTVLATKDPTFSHVQAAVVPNPATKLSQLVLGDLPASVHYVDVLLTDAVGRPIQHVTLPVMQGKTQTSLLTAGLTPGLYLFRLTGLDNQGVAVGTLPTQRVSLQ